MAISRDHIPLYVGVPKELDRSARWMARRMSVPMAVVVRRALAEYIEKYAPAHEPVVDEVTAVIRQRQEELRRELEDA